MNQHKNSYSYVRCLEQRAIKEEWNQYDPFLPLAPAELNTPIIHIQSNRGPRNRSSNMIHMTLRSTLIYIEILS